MKPLEFPENYQFFTAIRVGHINGAQALFTLGGEVPLLVGDGPVPRV